LATGKAALHCAACLIAVQSARIAIATTGAAIAHTDLQLGSAQNLGERRGCAKREQKSRLNALNIGCLKVN
jgi:hypothetical protein